MAFEPVDVTNGGSLDAVDDDLFHLEALAGLTNYQDWIVANFLPYLGGRTVEYGAGVGTISAKLLPHVSSLDLVEPLEPLVNQLRSSYGRRGDVQVLHCTIENSTRCTSDAEYDTAVLVNVLEHIEDHRNVLMELHRVLKPGGALCMFVPALPLLYSAYDRLVGHHRRYKLKGLKRLVVEAGFKISRARYFDMLGVIPWFIGMRMTRRIKIDSGAARLYDSVAVPVGRVIETVISPPIGKNIVLVAHKPKQTLG